MKNWGSAVDSTQLCAGNLRGESFVEQFGRAVLQRFCFVCAECRNWCMLRWFWRSFVSCWRLYTRSSFSLSILFPCFTIFASASSAHESFQGSCVSSSFPSRIRVFVSFYQCILFFFSCCCCFHSFSKFLESQASRHCQLWNRSMRIEFIHCVHSRFTILELDLWDLTTTQSTSTATGIQDFTMLLFCEPPARCWRLFCSSLWCHYWVLLRLYCLDRECHIGDVVLVR